MAGEAIGREEAIGRGNDATSGREARIIDRVTEAYCELRARTLPKALAAFELERQRIASRGEKAFPDAIGARARLTLMGARGGGLAFPSRDAEPWFRLFTRYVLETERSIKRVAKRRTTDMWLLFLRRELIASTWSEGQTPLERIGEELLLDQKMVTIVARWAAPGNTALPDGAGRYDAPLDERLACDVKVLGGLCELHSILLARRRRLLMGAVATKVPSDPFVTTVLPAHVDRRLDARAYGRGIGILARAGFHVASLDRADIEPGPVPRERLLLVMSRSLPTPGTNSPPVRSASEVRPFAVAAYDAARVLEALEFFAPAVRSRYGLAPREIVAAICCVSSYCIGLADRDPAYRYAIEARALFSIEVAGVREALRELLPMVSARLGFPLTPAEAEEVTERFLSRCTSTPRANRRRRATGDRPMLLVEVPFLFQADDKVLVDLASIPIAVSSLVNWLDLGQLAVQEKGTLLEAAVRAALLHENQALEGVPEMERTFRERGREIGQADVVVRCEDTAFVIECKSRRDRSTDELDSYAAAQKRYRDVGDWARQVRQLARYLADNPVRGKRRVPADVRFIVPIVCSPNRETVWQDGPEVFLVPDEVPIVMTPVDLGDFIRSRRWARRDVVSQYEVAHAEVRSRRAAQMAADHVEEAEREWRAVLAADPGNLTAAHALCAMLLEHGQPEEALATMKRARKLHPRNPAVLANFGDACFRLGRFPEALRAYEDARKAGAEGTSLLMNAARSLEETGEPEAAFESYARARELEPSSPVTHYNEATAFWRAGRRDEATRALEQAVRVDPDFIPAWHALGRARLDAGDREGAIEALDKAVAGEGPSESAHLLAAELERAGDTGRASLVRARVARQVGDFDQAVALLELAARTGTAAGETRHELALSLLGVGLCADAGRAFDAAQALEPPSFLRLLDFATRLREAGDLAQARLRLAAAKSQVGTDAAARAEVLASELHDLGVAFSRNQQRLEAIEVLEEALALEPGSAIIGYDLAKVLVDDGRLEEAAKHYERAVYVDPHFYEAWSNLGSVLARIGGRSDDAIAALLRALRLAPDDVLSLYALAQIYEREPWVSESERLYRRALEIARRQHDEGHILVRSIAASLDAALASWDADRPPAP